ncbi:MAG TPA: hypothetical protein VFW13_00605 [Phenylobacterium sp.]|nr:hypothetical protein [Phenylobacterium sp.]
MELHRPKLFHGWRELSKEVGVIVIGVAIALAGEETVRWLHEAGEVAEARKALRFEIAGNASSALFNVEEERCRSGYLDRVAAWANGGPRPLIKSTAGLGAGSTSTWDVVKAGAVAHMPLDERLAYSQFYSDVEATRWLIENERVVLFRVTGRALNDALTPAAAQLVREDITQARGMGRIHSGVSTVILQEAKAAGVDPQPLSAAARETLAGICADGGIAPAPSTP